MLPIIQANWIWENANAMPDEHADFFAVFPYVAADGKVHIFLSADSDFGLFINGKMVTFGQYPDYPHYKVYEKIEITPYLKEGENQLALEVWYYGNNCSTNIDDGAGLCFAIEGERGIILSSDENVLSRISKTYKSHACVLLTGQMGYTYAYDSNAEDAWRTLGGADFTPSARVTPNKILPTEPRPVKRLVVEKGISGKLIQEEAGEQFRYLFDFGSEVVGVYNMKFRSPCVQDIQLCYGEHVVDGWVRDIIGERRFVFDYNAKKGENNYFGYFRRLGLRYAEIRSQFPLEEVALEILPVNYPLADTAFSCEDEEMQRIYDICVNTLRLCLHDHYEDCPWREQAMYALDSRNQMLCGYYAFREYEFPKACIMLIAQDNRPDQMLSITYPGASGIAIPSFGLHFFTAVREYGDHSQDWETIRQILPKLESVLNVFTSRTTKESALIPVFGDTVYWNFYEWADGLCSDTRQLDEEVPDLILNELFSIALQNMQHICDKLGIKADYQNLADQVNEQINETFFSAEQGLYGMHSAQDAYSELGQALAVLCGAATGEIAQNICNVLCDVDSSLTKTTLAMKGFKYDALLKVDGAYAGYILEDIRCVYRKMLQEDATSVWEDEKGAAAFYNAGSLCHGWSALPVYYLHKLLG